MNSMNSNVYKWKKNETKHMERIVQCYSQMKSKQIWILWLHDSVLKVYQNPAKWNRCQKFQIKNGSAHNTHVIMIAWIIILKNAMIQWNLYLLTIMNTLKCNQKNCAALPRIMSIQQKKNKTWYI